MTGFVGWFRRLKAEAHTTQWGPTQLWLQMVSCLFACLCVPFAFAGLHFAVYDVAALLIGLTVAAAMLAVCFNVLAIVMVGWSGARAYGYLNWRTNWMWVWPLGLFFFDLKILQLSS